MFTELVESTKQKKQGRSRFYLVTSLLYGSSLSVAAIATILWANPSMAEANMLSVVLPPMPVSAPPPELSPAPKTQPDPGFVPPKTPPKDIMEASKVPPKPPSNTNRPYVAGTPIFGNFDPSAIGISNGPVGDGNEAPPPPPTPTPTPVVKPTPTPAPTPETPKMLTVSSGVLQGKAIRKIQPPYPQIARAVRAFGTVPVQITISEEGRVVSAQAVGGHPTLQQAAQQAAMQWVFSPTVLNGRQVQVSGVISFNFILN